MLKINFLGDSITEGALASKEENTYVSLVGTLQHAETRNYGISATRIAIQHKPSSDPRADIYFASRVKNMKTDADYVFVMGGTNDYGHGDAPFGEIGDKTPDTFCGAVDDLINELLKYYKKEQIVFIPPLYRLNEDSPLGDGSKEVPGKTLEEYRQALVTIVQKYGIKVKDIKDDMGKAENNPLFGDGLHPSDLGHRKIAELLSEYIKTLQIINTQQTYKIILLYNINCFQT